MKTLRDRFFYPILTLIMDDFSFKMGTSLKGKNLIFLSKWELLLKERICSQRERILSFKISFLWYGKIAFTTLGDLP